MAARKKYLIDITYFKILQKISTGGFGTVFMINNYINKTKYAAKIISGDTGNEQSRKMINREIGILMRLQHPNIIQFIGYSLKDFKGNDNVTLIMTLAEKGSLSTVLQNVQHGLADPIYDNTIRQKILIGIARGMMYLHKNHVIHRDLKTWQQKEMIEALNKENRKKKKINSDILKRLDLLEDKMIRNPSMPPKLQVQPKTQIIEIKKKSNFEGIIHYLTLKTNGNIHDNGTIEVTTNSIGNSKHPRYLLSDDPRNYLAKSGATDFWVCFDFKNIEFEISSYIAKKYNCLRYLRSQMMESIGM